MSSKFGGVPVDSAAGSQEMAPSTAPVKISKFGGVPVSEPVPTTSAANEDIPQIDNRPDGVYPNAQAPEPTAGQTAIGTGEAALALASGATTGAAGMIGGTIKGILDEVAAGKFGTQEAADRIEKLASESGAALTYAPRTQSGQEQTQAVGEALAPLAALGPMVSETAALSQGLKAIPDIARAAAPIKATATAARAEPEVGALGAAATKVAPEAAQAAGPAADAGVWTWNAAGKEHPVDILPQSYTSPDGKAYQRVLYQGKETFVAADDLKPPVQPQAASDVAGAAPISAKEAPPVVPAAKTEPSLGDMGKAPEQPTTTQQTVEGIAKNITEATQASKRAKIPTMERLADEARPDETILQAADRLGIKDQLIPSQYSKSQAYREIEQGLASIPGSQLNAQQKAATAMLAQKADDMIQQYGGNIDKAALSTDFKNRGMALVDDLSKQADDLYDRVREAIPVTTKITADSTVGYLTNRAKELGGAEALSPIERRTLTMLSGGGKQVPLDPNSPQALATYGQATEYQRNLPTYARVDLLRRQVGEGTRGRGPFKDADSGTLKQLYAKLSDDQQSAAAQNGAGELFSAAKQVVARRKAIEDDLIGVLGKDLSGVLTAKTGNAIRSLATGNYKDFDNIMSKIPKDQQQRVVMTSLNDALTAGSRMEKQLSAPGFTDWYEGLKRNNTARRRLYQYMPKDARRTLDDIAKVAKGMRDASKERITTGRIQALMDNFANEGGMLSKLYGLGKQVAVAEGVGNAIGLPGAGTVGVIAKTMSKEKTSIMKAADDLLSSQQFKNAVSDFAKSGGEGKKAKAAEARLKKSPQFKKWFNTLGKAQQAAVNSSGALTWLSQSVNEEGESKPSK